MLQTVTSLTLHDEQQFQKMLTNNKMTLFSVLRFQHLKNSQDMMYLKSGGVAFVQKLKHVSYCMSKHKQTRQRKK